MSSMTLAEEIWKVCMAGYHSDLPMGIIGPKIDALVERAVLAERERCNKVLDIVRAWNHAHTSIEGEMYAVPLSQAIEELDKS